MSFWDILVLYLIFTSLQPVMKQRMIESARQKMIAKIEKKRGSRVILLVHRQETMSFLGFPIYKYIDINDSEEVIRAIEMTDPSVPFDIILHTPGGLVLASLQIARAIKRHKGKVTVHVPHHAMSGGTLIALAADEIVMAPDAVLGPVDPQIGEFPAVSILEVVKQKPITKIDDRTLILADVAKKAIKQTKDAVLELLSGNYPDEVAEKIATELVEGKYTHDYPITYEKAKEMGLNVSCCIDKEIQQLMSLYPQPIVKRSSVEYLWYPKGR
ncbi:SDH family Clp fold serine proteinase [Anaerocellum danielii]|uniref:ATP-dependent Clp protease proteolytic subunit n=1 Tax=Anaerocellum danielii TaxID=1387557 RepID=A0ABZ0U548_9FIRM|nr:ATP-dependent Clp protease proteolytic subunit [Caldicellulosiruptor danielii]WPX08855.1 ATP-dependent Clp protease proteolytic subunit [Caldicellulosiruptor danielii]